MVDVWQLEIVDDDNILNWGPEGAIRVKGLNNAGRADEGMIARWFRDWRGDKVAAAGPTNYTLTSETKPTDYYDGFQFVCAYGVNNEDDATVNVDSLGAIPLLRTNGTAVKKDDLVANVPHLHVYMGGSFYVLTVPGLGSAANLDAGTAAGDVPVLDAFRAVPPEQQGIIGQVIWRASSNVPLTWFAADGQSLATATYPDLYAEIGNTFGGDATNFNVPDLGTKVVVGAGTGYALGAEGGAATVTLTEGQLPSTDISAQRADNQLSGGGGLFEEFLVAPGTAGSTPNTLGNDEAHENMPPYVVLYPLIKAGYPVS